MVVPVEQFIQGLLEVGLLTREDVSTVLSAAPDATKSAEALAREFVRRGKLTKFQAQAASLGKANGLVLGNYVILARLGEGGMGQVYKARHRRMGRVVALKVLPQKVTRNPQAVARFQREVQAAGRLSHPNVVTAFDADQHKGVHYFVMEYVDGTDLSTLVKETGVLRVDRAVDYVLQTAGGLEYAHGQGIVQRDIKPGNLLVDRTGTVKVLDMGLARFDEAAEAAAAAGLTTTGVVMGTIDYMSPEQALDTKHADARSDIYSLGATLWFLLTGRAMYAGDTVMKKLLAHREQPVPSLAAANPEVPAALDGVFQRMLAKDPARRFQTMADVIAALQGCLVPASSAAVPGGAVAADGESVLEQFLRAQEELDATFAVHGQGTSLLPDTVPSGMLDGTIASAGLVRSRSGRAAGVGPVAEWWRRACAAVREHKRTAMAVAAILVPVLVAAAILGWRGGSGGSETRDARREADVTAEPAADARSDERNPGNEPAAAGAPTGTLQSAADALAARSAPSKTEAEATADAPSSPALRFDGKSAFVHVRDFSPLGVRALTLECQVVPEAVKPGLIAGWAAFHLRVSKSGEYEVAVSDPATGDRRVEGPRVEVARRTHLAAVWNGGDLELYADGRRQPTVNSFLGFAESHYGLDHFLLGGIPNLQTLQGARPDTVFHGVIDEVRVSNTARYREDYVPEERLATDGETLALFHCDEGRGRRLADASRQRRTGAIVGATWALPGTDTGGSGGALAFDGASSHVRVPGLSPQGLRRITLEATVVPRVVRGGVIAGWGGALVLRITNRGRYAVWAHDAQGGDPEVTGPLAVAGQPVHLAAVWNGGVLELFVNGRREPTKLTFFGWNDTPCDNFALGCSSPPGGAFAGQEFFDGIIDEVRVTAGARYTDEFSPAARLEVDDETLALFHCDEGSGATVEDASPHARSGQVTGAAWVGR